MNAVRRGALAALLALAGPGAARAAEPLLVQTADVPLPGHATRFDYQSYDPQSRTLYIAHMGDGAVIAFDTRKRRVLRQASGFPAATGILAVPDLQRVFVSVPGKREVAVLEAPTLKVLARIPAGEFPDGLAYAADAGRVFVSDERGGREAVLDARALRRVATTDLGGEAGNTQYDPVARRVLVNVQTRNELVEIEPGTAALVARHPLTGGRGPHGLLLLPAPRLAFAACEGDGRLLVVDLKTFQVLQVLDTGAAPDVLAYDAGLERLYVAAESGVLSVFQRRGRALAKLADLAIPHAHSVAVDNATHEVFLPLQDVGGQPVLRIMQPPSAAAGAERAPAPRPR